MKHPGEGLRTEEKRGGMERLILEELNVGSNKEQSCMKGRTAEDEHCPKMGW